MLKTLFVAALAMGALVVAPGCGGDSENGVTNSGREKVSSMREALMELPYQVVLRDVETPPGARGIVAGRATDIKRNQTARFTFILGAPEGKWLRKYVGDVSGASYNWDLDMQSAVVGPDGKTWAEKEKNAEMETDIAEAVCRALSGEPCPI